MTNKRSSVQFILAITNYLNRDRRYHHLLLSWVALLSSSKLSATQLQKELWLLWGRLVVKWRDCQVVFPKYFLWLMVKLRF